MKKYWLMKSEPNVYSIDLLQKDKKIYWDGVRNYQARNNMKSMKVGDFILFYHSNANPKGVTGIAKVVREAYPDFTAFDKKNKYFDPKSTTENPTWYMVDIQFLKKFKKIITLKEIKSIKELNDMVLLKNSRLSVQPVKKDEFDKILDLEND